MSTTTPPTPLVARFRHAFRKAAPPLVALALIGSCTGALFHATEQEYAERLATIAPLIALGQDTTTASTLLTPRQFRGDLADVARWEARRQRAIEALEAHLGDIPGDTASRRALATLHAADAYEPPLAPRVPHGRVGGRLAR